MGRRGMGRGGEAGDVGYGKNGRYRLGTGALRGYDHIPVLLDEVLHNLVVSGDGLFVDATIGGGGHGYHLLETYRGLRLVGIDADVEALALAKVRLSPYKDRVLLKKGNFRDLKAILREESIGEVDAVLFDLGISLYQMSGERGFSFSDDAALDMRIDLEEALTAREVVNRYGYPALTRIIREYGEEGDAGADSAARSWRQGRRDP